MSKRGWILFLALGVLWGMPYLLIRIAVASLDPLVVAFGRTAIGAALLLPVALHRGALRAVLPHWRMLVVFTLVEISGPWLLLGHAETRLNSSTTGLMIAVVPLIAATIVTRLGHDRLGARRVAGLVIGFAGVAALVGLDVHADDAMAVAAIALCSLGYAIGPILIDRKLAGVPPLGVVAASVTLAALFYAPLAPFCWPTQTPPGAVAARAALRGFFPP